jgi:hypothetical protein
MRSNRASTARMAEGVDGEGVDGLSLRTGGARIAGMRTTASGTPAAVTSAAISRPLRGLRPDSHAESTSAAPWPMLRAVSSQARRWFHSCSGRRSTISRLAIVTAPANPAPSASASSNCSTGADSGNSQSDSAQVAAHAAARLRYTR